MGFSRQYWGIHVASSAPCILNHGLGLWLQFLPVSWVNLSSPAGQPYFLKGTQLSSMWFKVTQSKGIREPHTEHPPPDDVLLPYDKYFLEEQHDHYASHPDYGHFRISSNRIHFMCYETAVSCWGITCSSSFGKLFFKGPQTLVIKGAWIDYGTWSYL